MAVFGLLSLQVLVPRAPQQTGEPEEISCEGSGRDPPGDGACCDSRVTGA
jgi:hypothetical protein